MVTRSPLMKFILSSAIKILFIYLPSSFSLAGVESYAKTTQLSSQSLLRSSWCLGSNSQQRRRSQRPVTDNYLVEGDESKNRVTRAYHRIANGNRSRRDFVLGTSSFLLSTTVLPRSSSATYTESPQEIASSYDKFSSSYDALDGGSVADFLGINEARDNIIGMAKGKVLEIGAGTGLNLSKYKFSSSPSKTDGVSSLTLLDISDGMLAESKKKAMSMNIPSWVEIKFIKADATSMILSDLFEKATFDTVVDTFSFCVMGLYGAQRCLEQMRNVAKAGEDGGKILLIENTKSSNQFLGLYQDLTANAAAKMGGKGCVSNQDVRSLIMQTDGITLLSEEEYASGVFRSFVCVT